MLFLGDSGLDFLRNCADENQNVGLWVDLANKTKVILNGKTKNDYKID